MSKFFYLFKNELTNFAYCYFVKLESLVACPKYFKLKIEGIPKNLKAGLLCTTDGGICHFDAIIPVGTWARWS